jgi:RNA polymerase sigma factor (sigma-70 family)
MEARARGREPKLAHPSPPEVVAAARRALSARIASDFAATDDGDAYDPAALSAPEPEDHDARIDDADAMGRVLAALRFLPPGEAAVVRLRFGLVDGRGRTQAEAGAELGVSKQRAQQLEARALARLRKALGAKGVAA